MLYGSRVTLRAKRREDLARQVQFDNDMEFQLQAHEAPPEPISLEQLEAEFDQRLKETDRDAVWFAIEADGKFIGQCGLYEIKPVHGTCMLSINLGDGEYRGQGYGREVIGLLLEYAFRIRNLRKVCLTTGGNNERALRCYRACGLVEEGRQHQQEWNGGEYIDLVHMGILREAWKQNPAGGGAS